MMTVEERVSYIEGKLDSLATKEDLLRLVLALVGLQIISIGATAGIVKLLIG